MENVEVEKREKKLYWIVGIFGLVVIVALVVGFSFFGGDGEVSGGVQEGAGNQGNESGEVLAPRSLEWCSLETVLESSIFDDEAIVQIRGIREYEGEDVCYVVDVKTRNEYYFAEDRLRVYRVERVDGELVATLIP